MLSCEHSYAECLGSRLNRDWSFMKCLHGMNFDILKERLEEFGKCKMVGRKERKVRGTQPHKHKLIFSVVLTANVSLCAAIGAEEIRQTVPDEEARMQRIFALIENKGYKCLECHDVDKKVVGPAWRQVAVNRKNHKWAIELLSFKIGAGSVGEYGTAEMPHNEVSEEDAAEIGAWILSLSRSSAAVAAVAQPAGSQETGLELATGPASGASVARLVADEEARTQRIFALIENKGYKCLECHDVDEKVVGPAWRQVAVNRKNHKWATELLSFKIGAGSVGEYGTAVMPHNEVSEEDTAEIVNFILSLRP